MHLSFKATDHFVIKIKNGDPIYKEKRDVCKTALKMKEYGEFICHLCNISI